MTREESIQEEYDEVMFVSVCKNSITPIAARNRGAVYRHRELFGWKDNDIKRWRSRSQETRRRKERRKNEKCTRGGMCATATISKRNVLNSLTQYMQKLFLFFIVLHQMLSPGQVGRDQINIRTIIIINRNKLLHIRENGGFS